MSEKTIRVLLVEDNPGDARLLREMLNEPRSLKIELTHLGCMSEAVHHLATSAATIILLDLGLPDAQGLAAVQQAHEVAPGVPLVVLTGLDDEVLAAQALREGAQDYLIKGQIETYALLRSVRYAIERQRMQVETDDIRKELEETNRSLREQIVERQKAEEEAARDREKRLKMKDDLLSHVSHELRSPLTVVHQFASILLDGLGGPINANQREYLEITLRNVNQLKGMIGDLLEASRADTCKLTVKQLVISAGDVLKQTIRSFHGTAATKGISLQTDIPDNLPPVYADPGRIYQVLTNLLDNAVKFSPSKSSITVRARILEEDPTSVCISVADSGCGIEPEESERIFDRLYQAKNSLQASRRGLGLGLYICKELIGLHGGRMWNDSKRRDGCTLSFTLPVFSIRNMIAPIVKKGTLIDSSFALVTIDVRPVEAWPSERERERALSRIHHVIVRCMLPDLDVLLPPQNRAGLDLFWIVACTDQKGADVIVKRVREQISLCEDLKLAGIACSVSSEALNPGAIESEWPLERQVQCIVSCLEKLLQVEPTERSPLR